MTNDDRSYQDRPGDEPRYGERADHTDAPRYGEQQQYGQQQPPQYGQQDHGRPEHGGAPAWEQHQQPYAAAAAGGPAWQSYDEPKPKKKTVGVVAFVVGLAALVVGIVAGVLFGSAFGGSSALREATQGSSTTLSDSAMQELLRSPGAVTASLLFYLGTALGLWAIVQGIIAAATKRGRAWGVWAIVLAVVAVIVFFVVTGVSIAGAAANAGFAP